MEEKIKRMIEKNPLAFATIDKSGKPYVIAVADVKIISEDRILIGDNYMEKTIENLKNSPNVSLVVWDKHEKGYKIQGTAEYFSDGEWAEKAKEIHKSYPAKGAIVIEINEVRMC